MLRKPLIVGSKGNMARRYATILRHLGVEHQGVDLGDTWPELPSFDSVLICTPTDRHVEDIYRAAKYSVPILCEKPLTKDLDLALEVCDFAERTGLALRMVNQYAHLRGNGTGSGPTVYDYWNHGKDGLAWDCISVVALAQGPVHLGEESPVWFCQINGAQHYVSEMDYAYVDMLKSWLGGEIYGTHYIREAHKKVAAYLEATG